MRVCDRCQTILGETDENEVKVRRRAKGMSGLNASAYYHSFEYELCEDCITKLHNKIDAFVFPKSEVKDNDDN